MRGKTYNLWLTVRRAPDLPGQWLAHCLDLDVMTQGNSLAHAIEMAREAVRMVIEDDLDAGRDPLDRRAPEEDWTELYAVLDHLHPVDVRRIDALAPRPDEVFVGQLVARPAAAHPNEVGPRGWLPWGALGERQAA